MSEQDAFLTSIAATIADYRASELTPLNPEHVQRWISQFDTVVQIPILQELDHVLGTTYLSLQKVVGFLEEVIVAEKLVGPDPCQFWQSVAFLDIQQGGNSQREMRDLFDHLLQKVCSYGIAQCTSPDTFIYLDDGIFTGNRVRRDLEHWIEEYAPQKVKIYVITIAVHRGGYYYANGNIMKKAKAVGKDIAIEWWSFIKLEDRKVYTDRADVLRPISIPDLPAVQQYVEAMQYKPRLRRLGSVGGTRLFSDELRRHILEQEFLKAGVEIRQMCPNLSDRQRPLGHMTLETLGFGSLIVTFRNCPNNAPLALWVGDPWYPLFPRATNTQTAIRRLIEGLESFGSTEDS